MIFVVDPWFPISSESPIWRNNEVAGIDAISSLELTAPECWSMAISVGISCCCLGLGLAGLDKSDASVMGLPGKLAG